MVRRLVELGVFGLAVGNHLGQYAVRRLTMRGGGEAWVEPTSLALMVVLRWTRLFSLVSLAKPRLSNTILLSYRS